MQEVLVLGPNADKTVTFESCDWPYLDYSDEPCTGDGDIAAIGSISNGHGFLNWQVPSPPEPLPRSCTDPEGWSLWTDAGLPKPGPECEFVPFYRTTVLTDEASTQSFLSSFVAARAFAFPYFPETSNQAPTIDVVELDDGTLQMSAMASVPEDAMFFSEQHRASGGDGATVFFALQPETGTLVTPPPTTNTVPVNGTVTTAVRFSRLVDDRVRLAVRLAFSRAFPQGESKSWVVEVFYDADTGAWQQRTLLPSGQVP